MFRKSNIIKARRGAVEQLWSGIMTSIGAPIHYNLYAVDFPREEAFRCDAESWATIIGIVRKLDIRFIEHSSTEIELVAPKAEEFSIIMSLSHYEDESFDYAELEEMSIDEAIDELKCHKNDPKESFDYVLIHFRPSAMIGSPCIALATSPTDNKFWDFMVAAKDKLNQTADILACAIDQAPEPTRARAIKEQRAMERYEKLLMEIRQYILKKHYDKEFSLCPSGYDDVKLILRINDSYMCSGVICSSTFAKDLEELFGFADVAEGLFHRYHNNNIDRCSQYSSIKWEKFDL